MATGIISHGKPAIECDNCGLIIWAGFPEEMVIHEGECDWPANPRERFERGDRVKYSDLGLKRLNKDQREGEIVGFSEEDHCIRVRWDGNKTAARYAHSFIKPAMR